MPGRNVQQETSGRSVGFEEEGKLTSRSAAGVRSAAGLSDLIRSGRSEPRRAITHVVSRAACTVAPQEYLEPAVDQMRIVRRRPSDER